NNRYSAGTFVCGGTLQVTDQSNIGTDAVFMDSRTTLSITGDATFANDLLAGPETTLRVAAGRTVTWDGQVSDYSGGDMEADGPLSVTGGGVLELTNVDNSYSIGTIVGDQSTVR